MLESYTSKVKNASRHLVLISASCAVDDLKTGGTAAQSLATELHEVRDFHTAMQKNATDATIQKAISFHTFMDHRHEKNFTLDIMFNMVSLLLRPLTFTYYRY